MYFDPNTDDFLDYFPELSEAKVRGSNETASVIPASFLFMEMRDKNGNQPKTFETPGREEGIEITGTMDDEITNPETGEQMQPGDMGKIMILDEETGEWVEQGDTEVLEDGRWHWRWRWYSSWYWRYWYWGWYYYLPIATMVER